jgi:hypothetical protein
MIRKLLSKLENLEKALHGIAEELWEL